MKRKSLISLMLLAAVSMAACGKAGKKQTQVQSHLMAK